MPVMMFPTAMLMAAMFFSSIYFTFRDCFDATESMPDVSDTSPPKATGV
jgi:hypothetical protein